jgi:hypothetical protein
MRSPKQLPSAGSCLFPATALAGTLHACLIKKIKGPTFACSATRLVCMHAYVHAPHPLAASIEKLGKHRSASNGFFIHARTTKLHSCSFSSPIHSFQHGGLLEVLLQCGKVIMGKFPLAYALEVNHHSRNPQFLLCQV